MNRADPQTVYRPSTKRLVPGLPPRLQGEDWMLRAEQLDR
jgi:hypothetical protein